MPASYPTDVAGRATSLELELGRAVDRGLLLAEYLSKLAAAVRGSGGRPRGRGRWRVARARGVDARASGAMGRRRGDTRRRGPGHRRERRPCRADRDRAGARHGRGGQVGMKNDVVLSSGFSLLGSCSLVRLKPDTTYDRQFVRLKPANVTWSTE